MRSGSRFLSTIFLAAAFVSSLAGIGCGDHHHRLYDPYYSDYHTWDDHEVVFYNQWTRETHRDRHRDFHKLKKDEQKQYWDWRHTHSDHDRP